MKKPLSIPPTYFYLSIIINTAIFFFIPKYNVIPFPINLSGIALLIAGLYLIAKPYYLFKRYGTPEDYSKSTCVVCESCYKYSRNPMYLGAFIFLIGLAVFLKNVIGFISPVIFFLFINFMFIPFEENKMKNEIGQEYLEYKNRVRRWV